jgi:hypothetical protein
VPKLQAAGAHILAYDPAGMRSAKSLLPGVEFAERGYDCLEGTDAAVVMTEWDEFRALDLKRVSAALAQAIIVDLRNIYSIQAMKALGFRYVCIGRGLDRKSDAGFRPSTARTDNQTSSPAARVVQCLTMPIPRNLSEAIALNAYVRHRR